RLVLAAGPGERLLAPRPPVHGVLLVLEEIGAGFIGKAVHDSCPSVSAPNRRRRRMIRHPGKSRQGIIAEVTGPEVRQNRFDIATMQLDRSDTIFALASGAGRAGIAVMRLSGPACRFVLE